MVKTPLKLEGARLTIYQKTIIIFVSSLITAFVVFLFLFVIDGTQWGFIDAHPIFNLFILYGFGLVFALLFFRKEFNRLDDKIIKIDHETITATTPKIETTYATAQCFNVRYDRQFYILTGHERITLSFHQENSKRKLHEVIVFKKDDIPNVKEKIVNALKPIENGK